jgi:hypothetical protein
MSRRPTHRSALEQLAETGPLDIAEDCDPDRVLAEYRRFVRRTACEALAAAEQPAPRVVITPPRDLSALRFAAAGLIVAVICVVVFVAAHP